METMLESGLLDEMDDDVLQELCVVIAKKQEVRLGVSRDGTLLNELVGKWGDWLALQDVPAPRIRQQYKPRMMRSPKLSPLEPMTTQSSKDKGKRRPVHHYSPSPVVSPELRSQHTGTDDIFAMDDEVTSPPTMSGRQTPRSSRPMTPLDLQSGSSRPGQVPWKSRTAESGRYVSWPPRFEVLMLIIPLEWISVPLWPRLKPPSLHPVQSWPQHPAV